MLLQRFFAGANPRLPSLWQTTVFDILMGFMSLSPPFIWLGTSKDQGSTLAVATSLDTPWGKGADYTPPPPLRF